MDSKLVIIGVIVVVVIAVAAYSLMGSGTTWQNNTANTTTPVVTTIVPVNVTNTTVVNATNGTNSTGNSTTPIAQNNTSKGTLFSNTSYFQSAYLISGAVLTPQARAVMSGYTLSSSLQDNGSTIYNLTQTSTSQSTFLTVLQGQALYFINTTVINGQPNPSGADGYALVDSQGYVLNLVYPLQ